VLNSAEGPDETHRLTFLGTGTSTGVPAFGCDCAVCTSTDPRNQRTRPSVLLQFPGGNAIIDTTPEMRLQLLRARINKVHAILFTHHHADHLFGLDDARLFPRAIGGPVPIYCEADTEQIIRSVFHYAFDEHALRIPTGGVPRIQFHVIEPNKPFSLLAETVVPFRLHHGRFRVLGFRVRDLAYCTDVNHIPDDSWKYLEGLDTLIIDALRPQPHPTHFSVAEAVQVVEKVRPRRTYLTHLSHLLDHATTESTLPGSVRLAYDGLSLSF
jgi:phosphoribosyl 1,2-cyclic phosphate phosphodiesterase